MNNSAFRRELLQGLRARPRTLVLPNARHAVPVYSPSAAFAVFRNGADHTDEADEDSDNEFPLTNLPTISWLDDIDVERILDANDAD